jgi:hypothetical protein
MYLKLETISINALLETGHKNNGKIRNLHNTIEETGKNGL